MIKIDIQKKLLGAEGAMRLKVDLEIKHGEFIALSGKSGSGKSTLLRILAGLESAEGQIIVDGEVWQNAKGAIAPQKRRIGFVFQDYALFANMSVMQNLLFVEKNEALANELLEITELSNLKDRKPSSLSGGQQQRVSLCRALMRQPKLLLLDEPLSALDSAMRRKLQDEILALHARFGITTIMVSHDISEIYRLSERMVRIDHGAIIGDGKTKEALRAGHFHFHGEVLEIRGNQAIISTGNQIIEMPAKELQVGQNVMLEAKSFEIC